MTENDWLMQFLADVIDVPVDRPVVRETTARGAAMLALMQSDGSITLEDLSGAGSRCQLHTCHGCCRATRAGFRMEPGDETDADCGLIRL